MVTQKPKKKHMAIIKNSSEQESKEPNENINLSQLKFDKALAFLAELLKKINTKAAANGVNALQVRAIDRFDREYDPSGISYLVYFANEIEKKKKEIENVKQVNLRFKKENNNEQCLALIHFFPNFPENFKLAPAFNKSKTEEEIIQAANDARKAVKSADAAKQAADAAQRSVEAAEAAQRAVVRADQAVADLQNTDIIKEARIAAKNCVAALYKEHFEQPAARVEAAKAEAARAKTEAEAEIKIALKEKADLDRELAKLRDRLEQQDREKAKISSVTSHEAKHEVKEIKQTPTKMADNKVSETLLVQAQKKLQKLSTKPREAKKYFEKQVTILEEVVDLLKEKTAIVKVKKSEPEQKALLSAAFDELKCESRNEPLLEEYLFAKDIIVTLLDKNKFLLEPRFEQLFLDRLKVYYKNYDQSIMSGKINRALVKTNKNDAIIFLLEDIITMANEASLEKRLAHLLHEANKLPQDNVLKAPVLAFHTELSKVKDKIKKDDVPKMINLIKTIPIPKGDLQAYEAALKEAETISIGNTPWKKSKIGLICAGIGLVALGIGLCFVPGAFPFAIASMVMGVDCWIGAGVLPGKESNKFSLFNAAHQIAHVAKQAQKAKLATEPRPKML